MKTTRTSLFLVAVLGLLAVCGSVQATEDNNLISYWRFDEGNGITAYDFFGNNDGTIYGAEWTTGQVDGALSFDGIDDYVSLGSPDSLDDLPLGNFTVSAWIYDEHTAGTTWGTIAGCYAYNRGWVFRTFSNTDGSRFLTFEAPHSGIWVRYYSVDGTISQDTWHHVAAVWDVNTKTVKLYIDGAEPQYQKTDAGTGTYNSDASRDKEIGRLPHVGGGHYFNGVIDEVAIYDGALSAEEIRQIYKRGLSGQGLPVERIIAIKNIKRAVDEKLEALERIDAALQREHAALQALNKLPADQQLRGLRRADILRARVLIYQSLIRQHKCKLELQRSISELERSLEFLNSD